MESLIIFLIVAGVGILILRWVGAWMLRIDEVIKHQKEMIEVLRATQQPAAPSVSDELLRQIIKNQQVQIDAMPKAVLPSPAEAS